MTIQTLLLEGAPAVRLHGPAGDTVTVLLRGAQVVSWVDAGGVERLYRSPLSPLRGPQAVRAGVPVIFPQFAARGPLVRHGFARLRNWALLPSNTPTQTPHVALQLHNAVGDDPLWPHACRCTLTVGLWDQALDMALHVENTGTTAFAFQAALHTYLAVDDVTRAQLTGVLPDDAPLGLQNPIDRVFEAVATPLQLRTPQHALQLVHRGFRDAVVWNPGPAAALADLPQNGYRQFVCVEAAQLTPVQLAPGAHWEGSQTVVCEAAAEAAAPAHATPS